MATVSDFLSTLGVNTHFDFANSAYQQFDIAVKAINFLGLKRLRDCAQKATTPALWQNVTNATGAKFQAYLPTGSTAAVQTAFDLLPTLMLNKNVVAVEGPNEEDVPYAIQQGNSLAAARQFQIDHVAPYGSSASLPVVNMSFGAGWTSTNNWHGNYDKVGDMSPYCNYGNAHTYPNYSSNPLLMQRTTSQIVRLNGLAQIAAPGRPVMTTEIGWDERHGFSQAQVATFALQAAFGGFLSGNPYTYFYALFDDASGKFGLMNADGTPKPAGQAIHSLITLLSPDAGMPSLALAPTYGFTPTAQHDQAVLLQGASAYWLALWNEVDAPRTIQMWVTKAKGVNIYHAASGTPNSAPFGATTALLMSPEVTLIKIV